VEFPIFYEKEQTGDANGRFCIEKIGFNAKMDLLQTWFVVIVHKNLEYILSILLNRYMNLQIVHILEKCL